MRPKHAVYTSSHQLKSLSEIDIAKLTTLKVETHSKWKKEIIVTLVGLTSCILRYQNIAVSAFFKKNASSANEDADSGPVSFSLSLF